MNRRIVRPTLLFAALTLAQARAVAAPYRLVSGFPDWPPEMRIGQVAGVATDRDGNVIVTHRSEPPILVFSKDGKFLRSFGDKMFPGIHGTRVDKDNHLWVTDMRNHTVVKFSLDGQVLLALGERDQPGEDEKHFNRPTDVAVAANGDFYVADGYGNSRVVKFDKTGKFLRAWGRKGTGPGEFNLPHCVLLDRKGLVYVADRENDRIQVFDPNGRFLRQFGGFAPFGFFLAPDDTLFVADGRAHKAVKMTLDGTMLATWGTLGSEPGNFILPHGITVGADGAVYVTEINGRRIQKFVPNQSRVE